MDDGQSVEHTVAIVVELVEVEGVGHHLQGFDHEVLGVVSVVDGLVVGHGDPLADGDIDVEFAVGLLQIVVTERPDATISREVHHVVEMLLGVGGSGVGKVDEEYEKLALARGGESGVDAEVGRARCGGGGRLHIGFCRTNGGHGERRGRWQGCGSGGLEVETWSDSCLSGRGGGAFIAQGRWAELAVGFEAGESQVALGIAQEGVAIGGLDPMAAFVAAL